MDNKLGTCCIRASVRQREKEREDAAGSADSDDDVTLYETRCYELKMMSPD